MLKWEYKRSIIIKDKTMSKNNYLPLGILTGVTLLAGSVLASTGSHATVSCTTTAGVTTCTETKNASVTVSGACGFTGASATREVPLSLNGGTSTESGATDVATSVFCNTASAFSVNVIGYSNDTDGNTNLVGTNSNTIATGNDTATPTNSYWAMKFTVSGTGANAPTVVSPYTAYSAIPSSSTPVVNYPAVTDVSTRDDYSFYTQYKVYAAPTQAADTYTGKVKYTLSQS